MHSGHLSSHFKSVPSGHYAVFSTNLKNLSLWVSVVGVEQPPPIVESPLPPAWGFKQTTKNFVTKFSQPTKIHRILSNICSYELQLTQSSIHAVNSIDSYDSLWLLQKPTQ